jgi:quercetin dioxygenase-like cupin family protein
MAKILTALKTAVVLVAFTAVAQQQTVEITAEPSHHLVFENAFVRVFDVTVAPKASTLVHRHNYDYVFVTLGDSDVTSARTDAPPVQLKLQDGEVRFSPGKFAHAAINNSDRPFRNITIELLNPSTGAGHCVDNCAVDVGCKSADKTACPSVLRGFSSGQWAITSVTLPPAAVYPQHSHSGPHLSVAVTDADLQVTSQDGKNSEIHQKVGDIGWHDPAVHTITNTGSKPATWVSLEFKGVPGK